MFCVGGRTVGVELLGSAILEPEQTGGEGYRDELWVNDPAVLSIDFIKGRCHLQTVAERDPWGIEGSTLSTGRVG